MTRGLLVTEMSMEAGNLDKHTFPCKYEENVPPAWLVTWTPCLQTVYILKSSQTPSLVPGRPHPGRSEWPRVGALCSGRISRAAVTHTEHTRFLLPSRCDQYSLMKTRAAVHQVLRTYTLHHCPTDPQGRTTNPFNPQCHPTPPPVTRKGEVSTVTGLKSGKSRRRTRPQLLAHL